MNRLKKVGVGALVAAIAVVLLRHGDLMTPQGLLQYIPERSWGAVAFLLVGYFLKSVSLFFPVLVLQTAAGLVFPPWEALAINFAGSILSIAVSYGAGRCYSGAWLEKYIDRYPKLKEGVERQREHVFTLCLLLRLPGFFPMDVTGAYLGLLGLSFPAYFAGSLLGMLPHILMGTFLGATVSHPGSPGFLISVGLMLTFTAVSALILGRVEKRRSKTKKTSL